jgi:hypothetical protein
MSGSGERAGETVAREGGDAPRLDSHVRHEALLNRVGCRSPPPGCRSSSVKRGAA